MTRPTFSGSFLLVALAALIVASPGHSGVQAPPSTLHVELDIFSGRPNPSWELTPSESAEFLKRLRSLPPTSQGSPREGLGYRGLIVTSRGGSLDSFDSVVVSNSVVAGRRAQNPQRFIDKDRGFEKWLLGTGKSHLDPAIYAEASKGL